LRYVGTAARSAEGTAAPGAAGDQLEGAGGDLLPSPGYADDEGLAPALVGALQRLAHDLDVADALEAVVHTATGHIDDGGSDVVNIMGIDEVGHAELPGQFGLGGVGVDADDAVGSDHARTLDDVEADAAEPEYRDRAAGFHLGIEHHRADAGGDAAADVANLVV